MEPFKFATNVDLFSTGKSFSRWVLVQARAVSGSRRVAIHSVSFAHISIENLIFDMRN